MSRSLVAFEACGCTAAIHVIQSDHPEWARKFLVDEFKAGLRIVDMDTDEWKAQPMRCPDHPDGPPWWKSNGGKGKRPAEYQPQQSLGLEPVA